MIFCVYAFNLYSPVLSLHLERGIFWRDVIFRGIVCFTRCLLRNLIDSYIVKTKLVIGEVLGGGGGGEGGVEAAQR